MKKELISSFFYYLLASFHISNSSTTQAFINGIKPEYSVINVRSNSYGHPTDTVLNRLVHSGSKVWRNILA